MSYGDELVWAAIWLHRATGNITYLEEAKQYYEQFELAKEKTNSFSYDKKQIGLQVNIFQFIFHHDMNGNALYDKFKINVI